MKNRTYMSSSDTIENQAETKYCSVERSSGTVCNKQFTLDDSPVKHQTGRRQSLTSSVYKN